MTLTPQQENTRLTCRALVAGYGERQILRGMDLTLRSGEITAIIGPNGSGKSTLLRCLAGELRPQSGTVLLDGTPLPLISARARARRIAVLPQRLPVALPSITAGELVLLGRYPHLAAHGLLSRSDRKIARQALEDMEAAPLSLRSLTELSGGELQRVFLARALAQEADILLLDEPASALDPARSADLFRQLDKLARSGACIAAVLHDVNAAALFCRRVIALRAGKLRFDVPPTLLTSQKLSELYDTPLRALEHPTAGVPQFCMVGLAPLDSALPDDTAVPPPVPDVSVPDGARGGSPRQNARQKARHAVLD